MARVKLKKKQGKSINVNLRVKPLDPGIHIIHGLPIEVLKGYLNIPPNNRRVKVTNTYANYMQ